MTLRIMSRPVLKCGSLIVHVYIEQEKSLIDL